ncbi:MAG: DsbA family protein [bacterium]
MDPLASQAPLIVYLDIKSPYAFIAVKPTLALQEELGITIDWRALTLDIPSYLGSARKSAGKVVSSNRSPAQWLNVKYAYKDARRYAERQGYVLKGTEKIWDSSLANMGINWVAEQAPDRMKDYFDSVYPPFWRRELDIEDVDAVSACLQAAGVDAQGFRDYVRGPGRIQHDTLQAKLHDAGIYGVPSYVFDNKILFGREHLPYVRWSLNGKQGRAPDMAYTL